ncbi:MAG TPA: NAD(P)-dependent oxidoreductase [Gemmatimonadaceae bacterium]|nr:NAD(P)-dependent oxidoreductase [Gemmatimonadaceae bacterium]
MKIFVAGATGVIGRRLIPLLVDAGSEVTAVARTKAKAKQLEKQGATPVSVDLFDALAVKDAVAGHNTVINMATSIPTGGRTFLPGAFNENIRIRTEASRNLSNAAIATRAQRFVQESFAPAYPDRDDEWIDEDVPLMPAKYVESVLDAEAAAAAFTKNGGAGVVLRFSFFYGPDSPFTLDMVKSVKRGFAPALGGGDRFMSSIWHDDAAAAVFASLRVPAGTYNVTDNHPMRRREAFDLLASALGVKAPRIPPLWLAKITGSIGETLGRSHRLSNAKFRQASGWVPSVPSVREGWKLVAEQLKNGPERLAHA